MGHNHKSIHMVTFLLLIVGGLNWLLIGLFGMDVVAMLGSSLARLVYIAVGAAAVYEFATHKSTCKTCAAGGSSHKGGDQHPSQNEHQEHGM